MTTYNGHKDWDYWNVSLWINNDEGLYLTARHAVRVTKTKTAAAQAFVQHLKECGITKTPDGAVYTQDRVAKAMREM